jgi:hypothetical protein
MGKIKADKYLRNTLCYVDIIDDYWTTMCTHSSTITELSWRPRHHEQTNIHKRADIVTLKDALVGTVAPTMSTMMLSVNCTRYYPSRPRTMYYSNHLAMSTCKTKLAVLVLCYFVSLEHIGIDDSLGNASS